MHPRWRTGSRSPPRWPPVNAAALGLSPAQRSEACPGLRQARHCPTPLSLPWVCVCPEPFSVPVPVCLSVCSCTCASLPGPRTLLPHLLPLFLRSRASRGFLRP